MAMLFALWPRTLPSVTRNPTLAPSVDADTKRVQQYAFRLLQGAAHRTWQGDAWAYPPLRRCDRPSDTGCMSYTWSGFQGMVSSLVTLLVMLQMNPACDAEMQALRHLVTAVPHRPASDAIWWWDQWLPAVVRAFSCGAHEGLPLGVAVTDLPPDMHDHADDPVVLRSWRLVDDYLPPSLGSACAQKQTENCVRREDYDLSLYVPFLDRRLGTPYMQDKQMRTGFPSYIGPGTWSLFHICAQRIADADPRAGPQLVTHFLTMFRDFAANGQPCPACRAHFLQQVSQNDKHSPNVLSSEANLYPIEWLLLGNILDTKLAAVTDPRALVLFLWKLHNAVSSSIADKKDCRTTEVYDRKASPQFRCAVWPFAKRYEYALGSHDSWAEARRVCNGSLRALVGLDTADARRPFLHGGHGHSEAELVALREAVAAVDEAFLQTGLLRRRYRLRRLPPFSFERFVRAAAEVDGLPPP